MQALKTWNGYGPDWQIKHALLQAYKIQLETYHFQVSVEEKSKGSKPVKWAPWTSNPGTGKCSLLFSQRNIKTLQELIKR